MYYKICLTVLKKLKSAVAEPALIAVSAEAGKIAGEGGLIEATSESMDQSALRIRLSEAVSVGLAILVGVLRILMGWPLHYLIIGGYILASLISLIAPKEIIGIAFDAGGVTTSTITVPLVAALGVGLSSIIKGRSPLLDGFGLVAFAHPGSVDTEPVTGGCPCI